MGAECLFLAAHVETELPSVVVADNWARSVPAKYPIRLAFVATR